MGLSLPHPFIAGASPLADRVDDARRLEDAGWAAIVLRSLFEEQITAATSGRTRHLDPLDPQFKEVLSYFPEQSGYVRGPVEYLEHLHAVKQAVAIPIVGSLNGTTPEAWLKFALDMQQAGADAIELNIYDIAASGNRSAAAIEYDLVQMAVDLKGLVTIPVAVKLTPFYTSVGHVATTLDAAGIDAIVLFNRFYQPDFDLDHLTVKTDITLSTSTELRVRLRWLALLSGRVKASLVASGGIAEPADGVKAILAGAHAVQMVSAVLRHGAAYLSTMRDGLRAWLDGRGYATLADARGRLSLAESDDPGAFERAHYIRAVGAFRHQ
jgi:dihydroorotate dehydrogenase (fumarate)